MKTTTHDSAISGALIVVDVQRYYLEQASSLYAYTESCWSGSMSYITNRVRSTVFPAINRLRESFTRVGWPTVYLRLCGTKEDRTDLHRLFRAFWASGREAGFDNVYPLANDSWADVCPEIAPIAGDTVLDKRTYSGFSGGQLEPLLRSLGVSVVVMTGLATSQCVDTTARDASELGFVVVHVEDAQADYGPQEHEASLFASRGICGGHVVDSEFLAAAPRQLLHAYASAEKV